MTISIIYRIVNVHCTLLYHCFLKCPRQCFIQVYLGRRGLSSFLRENLKNSNEILEKFDFVITVIDLQCPPPRENCLKETLAPEFTHFPFG